ncbi:hypothetical protein GNX71_20340 [Variovorax sp. RKNM96]|uniref:hypothetical protein n=1 Tax=Variovorax sp. RKNM96 TaxID=2681552 RepID=UPI001980716D|nr:hypothetical protein [Variovorax sp. RKNM96]QSI31801.1 hypothetical protein GNX71_20340 [Variovorax sp. RKNM96]
MAEYEFQGEWLVSLPPKHQVLFLTALSHSLTIAGRDSYFPQTEELEHPTHLRRINEIQHRVAACTYELLVNLSTESFQRSIARLVLDQSDHKLLANMQWAWRTAKERVSTDADIAAPNHMNLANSSETLWVGALSDDDCIRFMVLLAHGLTIGQRVLCYDRNVEGVKQLNQVSHQVAGLLVDHFNGRTRPLFEPFFFKLTDAQARIQGDQAWAYAKSHFDA